MWFQKISTPIKEGGGVLKAKIFKGMYEPKLEFPEWGGGGVQTKKKTLCGGSMDTFWSNTLHVLVNQLYCMPYFKVNYV